MCSLQHVCVCVCVCVCVMCTALRTVAFLVAQKAKNLPAVLETWVRSLGREDPLEKGMATRVHILAWKSPLIEEPGMLQSLGSQRVGHD